MKNQILIQKRQRYWYDRCLEESGAQLVEFGTKEGMFFREELLEVYPPLANLPCDSREWKL